MEEHIWMNGTDARFDQALRRYRVDAASATGGQLCWAVLVPGERPEVIMGGVLAPDSASISMRSIIEELGGLHTIYDALFAAEIYYHVRTTGLVMPALVPSFPAEPDVENLLQDSRGWLLWQFQLENVLCLFLPARTRAIEMRRRLNQRRTDAWDWAEETEMASGKSLAAFLHDRLLLGGASPGQWKSARELLCNWRRQAAPPRDVVSLREERRTTPMSL
jgi:hypothetical protein